jgi:predicted membrane-bound spermidine synthase
VSDITAPSPGTTPRWIAPAFFCSGFAALTYQVVWQRVLFASFGINVEAVTVVVTAFLLGLGLGSLAGGVLSESTRFPQLVLFAALELLIGLYGLISIPLFHRAAEASLGMSAAAASATSFVLVVIPTLLMGATLPLLVAFAVRYSGNVGMSVGWLYFVNTAGSALAAIATVVVLMREFGLAGSVQFAAALNFLVGLFVLMQHQRMRAAA